MVQRTAAQAAAQPSDPIEANAYDDVGIESPRGQEANAQIELREAEEN